MRLFFLAATGLILASCGDDDTTTTDSNDSGTTDTETTPGDDDDDTNEDKSAALSGTVTDANGSPLVDVNIRFCRGDQCRYFTTLADGGYEFADVVVDGQAFEAVPPEGSGLTTAFVPLEFETGQARVVDVMIPVEATPVPLPPATPAELDLGSVLLTVAASDLEPPLFVEPATEASATLVPEGDWLPTDTITGTVVAMWYVLPFDHHAATGLPVRFDLGSIGLAGATYEVWVGEYDEARWAYLGTITESGGGIYEGGYDLPLTSTLILVEE